MKLIHLTDTHLLGSSERLFNINVEERLELAVESINRNHEDAAFCVITGDITHLGEEKAFKKFSSIARHLCIPWYPIVGNHDLRANFREAFGHIELENQDYIQYTVENNAGLFLFIDTVEEGNAAGFLCNKRLTWLEEKLVYSVTNSMHVYIFMHHAPLDVGIPSLDQIKLSNGNELKKIVSKYPGIRHLFFGHLHRSCHGSWSGIPFSTVKATAHQMALKAKAPALQVSNSEKPAYAVVLLSKDDVIIHDHCFLNEDNIMLYNDRTQKLKELFPKALDPS